MKRALLSLLAALVIVAASGSARAWGGMPALSQKQATREPREPLRALDPPEHGFYARVLEYERIPINAAAVVADEAFYAARDRLERMLKHLPVVRANLRDAGAELHIIGKDQVTSD